MIKRIELYRPVDVVLDGNTHLDNGFFADVKGVFISEFGKRIEIPGFYNGNNRFVVRFSPNQLGEWAYTITSKDVCFKSEDREGKFLAVESKTVKNHGPVVVSKEDNYGLRYENQSSYFMNAYEADWIWAMELERIEEFICQIKSYGFNTIVTNLYAHDTRWLRGNTSRYDYGPPPIYVFEGDNENPNHSKMNISFFEKYDKFMDLMLAYDMDVHIYYKVYNKYVNWMEKYSYEDELYIRYVTSRYQAYTNVVWDVAKESFREPDKEYIAWYIKKIRSYDGYGRLVTTHDDLLFMDNVDYCKLVDFVTVQHQGASIDKIGSSTLYELYYYAMTLKQRYKKPLFYAEFGYESGKGGELDKTYEVAFSSEDILDAAVQVIMSKSYPCYYYTNTGWDFIDYSYIPKGYKYLNNLFMIIKEYSLMEWEISMPAHTAGCLTLKRNRNEYFMLIMKNCELTINVFDMIKDSKVKKVEAMYIGIQNNKKVKVELFNKDSFDFEDNVRVKSPFLNQPSFLYIKI